MESSHGGPVDAPARRQNFVNRALTAYFPRHTNLPPPDPRHEEVLSRVTESERRLTEHINACFAAVPRRLKKIFTFRTRKVTEPKKSVLKHELPRLTPSWHQDHPGWEGHRPNLQAPSAVSSTQDLERPPNSAAVEQPQQSVLEHRLPRLTPSWHQANPGWNGPISILLTPIDVGDRPVRPPNSDRLRPVPLYEDDQEHRHSSEWTRDPAEYETTPVRDSLGQEPNLNEPDREHWIGDHQTLDHEHEQSLTRRFSDVSALEQHQAFDSETLAHEYQQSLMRRSSDVSALEQHRASDSRSYAVPSNPFDSAEEEVPGNYQTEPASEIHQQSLTQRSSSVYALEQHRASDSPSYAVPSNPFDSAEDEVPVNYQTLDHEPASEIHQQSSTQRSSRVSALEQHRASDNRSYAVPSNPFDSAEDEVPSNYQTLDHEPAPEIHQQSFMRRSSSISALEQHRASDSQTLDHEHQQSFMRRTSSVSALEASDSRLVPTALVATQPPSQVDMDDTRASVVLDTASVRDSVMTSQKFAAIKIAKEQEKAIHEKLRRIGHDIPKYEFQELIGKGAYGRVFKCFDQEHNRVVALKVIDVDTTDYKVNARAKDDTIYDTVHEIKVLSQLKDSKAKNVNTMFDAFQVHSQLWIVNDYCPGGSVHTLMRATGNKLEDRYIVPIARELAVALRAVHAAGIIHRDVKSANVMVHENGSLQVIDFGVAGVLQTKVDKRSTVIGTPHWMPPELHRLAPPQGLTYGTEVDVWAYGCTLYEIATGSPPNSLIEPGRRLGATLGRTPPKLDRACFSEGLCNLIAFVLEAKPADRPSMEAVLEQKYLVDTEETHPTSSLAELVKTYYRWERSGGHRHSLFFPGGAPAVEFPETLDSEGSWNFSLTENFEQHFVDSEHLNQTLGLAPSTIVDQAADNSFDSYPLSPTPTVFTPSTSPRLPLEMSISSETPKMTDHPATENESDNEERVKRGEQAMQGLFDENKASYKYEVKNDFNKQRARQPMRLRSDLPLRHETEQSSLSHNELEVRARSSDTDSMPNIDLANVDTIRANRMHRLRDFGAEEEPSEPQYGNDDFDRRATLDFGWTFPQALPATTTTTGMEVEEPTERATVAPPVPALPLIPAPPHPYLLRAQTMPIHQLSTESRQSTVLDLDELYDSDALYTERTSRVTSDEEAEHHAAAEPNHQELSDVVAEENKSTASTDGSVAFDYGPSNAEISEHSTTSSDNEVDSGDDYHPSPPRPLVFPEPMPPSAAAMRDGASAAVLQAELTRMFTDFTSGMDILAEAFARAEGEEDGEEMGGEANGDGEE